VDLHARLPTGAGEGAHTIPAGWGAESGCCTAAR
jgi:hypothetical protein